MMNVEEIKERIRKIVTPIIESSGAYLVDLNLKETGRKLVLEIFVDTDTGITIGKCEEISRSISETLDFYDPIPGSYRLEVSSPGVGNPLKVKRQYRTNIGRFVKVKYFTDEPTKVLETFGRIISADDENVTIQTREGEVLTLNYDQILETKVEIVW